MPPMLNEGSKNAFDVGTWAGADVECYAILESRWSAGRLAVG